MRAFLMIWAICMGACGIAMWFVLHLFPDADVRYIVDFIMIINSPFVGVAATYVFWSLR